jgi:D-lactate dehydrogenase (cytochrome)
MPSETPRFSDMQNPLRAGALDALEQLFGDRFSRGEALRAHHANSITWHKADLPDAVIFPLTVEEVQQAVRICNAAAVPIIAYGAGTSLEGHINATFGGVTFDLSRMNRILSVNAEDLDCEVEAGVTRLQLNRDLRDQGLFFPIDPGADTTLGGMAATRASGTNAVRYGTMRENVVSITAVLSDGTLIKTSNRARKSSAGYDLTRLLIGSEGTLAIITSLVVRLHGIPERVTAAVLPFSSLVGACNTAIATIQVGMPIARIELIDELQVKISNAYSKLSLVETPTLFVEFHGTTNSVLEQMALLRDIAADNGALSFDTAEKPEERSVLWQARHDTYWATSAWRPGAHVLTTDACVPISRLAECITLTRRDLDEHGLVGPIIGHVGDGNFHVTLLFDAGDDVEVSKIKAFVHRLSDRAIAMDGTCTGEHGVGQGKVSALLSEMGTAVDVMRNVKQALDPKNIMNPGKIFRQA